MPLKKLGGGKTEIRRIKSASSMSRHWDSCDSVGPSTTVVSGDLPGSRNEAWTRARQRRIEQMAHVVDLPSVQLQALKAPEYRLLVSLLEGRWEIRRRRQRRRPSPTAGHVCMPCTPYGPTALQCGKRRPSWRRKAQLASACRPRMTSGECQTV